MIKLSKARETVLNNTTYQLNTILSYQMHLFSLHFFMFSNLQMVLFLNQKNEKLYIPWLVWHIIIINFPSEIIASHLVKITKLMVTLSSFRG